MKKDPPPATFVLSIGGSFNPIHMSHVRAMEVAKKVLERLFPDATFVGMLATAHQSHVLG